METYRLKSNAYYDEVIDFVVEEFISNKKVNQSEVSFVILFLLDIKD